MSEDNVYNLDIEADRSYNIKETARKLGCSRGQVYFLINIGELYAFRIGSRSLRITGRSIINFVKNNQYDPANDSV